MNIAYESNHHTLRPMVSAAVRRIQIAWLAASGIEILLSPGSLDDLATIAALSPLRMVLMAAMIFAAIHLIPTRWERCAMPAAFLILMGTLITSFTRPYLAACCLILGILIVYSARGWCRLERRYHKSGIPTATPTGLAPCLLSLPPILYM